MLTPLSCYSCTAKSYMLNKNLRAKKNVPKYLHIPCADKERQFADGRGGGRGAESYDRKKAWSSINHSIPSVPTTLETESSLRLIGSITDKKENKIFLIAKEIQMVSGAKTYMRKGFLYEEIFSPCMRRSLVIYMPLHPIHLNFLILYMRKILFCFLSGRNPKLKQLLVFAFLAIVLLHVQPARHNA
jgi:hypothetical protein